MTGVRGRRPGGVAGGRRAVDHASASARMPTPVCRADGEAAHRAALRPDREPVAEVVAARRKGGAGDGGNAGGSDANPARALGLCDQRGTLAVGQMRICC